MSRPARAGAGSRCERCRDRRYQCRDCWQADQDRDATGRREAARDRATTTHRLPDVVEVKAVGVTFAAGYPENLHRVKEHAAAFGIILDGPPERGRRGLECSLIREPDNPHDSNAVLVLAGGEPIGHLPRAIAARMAHELDSGVAWVADVVGIVYWPDKPEQPGIWIRARRDGAQHAREDR